jgi:peptide/nickel transport system substrate-binding protein
MLRSVLVVERTARPRRVAFLALAALFATLAAFVPKAGAPADAPPLRIGMTTEPNSLNPLFALNDYEQLVDRLIFDVLISVDASGRNFVPRLAAVVPSLQNGGISRDGLTLTYRLRHGVKWQDGAPFTSRDVKFSLEAILNPANNVPNRHGYDLVRSVDTPDPHTVVFHLKQPYAPALSDLFGDGAPNPILPAHLLARYADLNHVPFNQHPIGTGPFALLRWDHGQSVELVRNDDFYGGRPKLERLSVRFVPDEATMINQLRTHELDVFTQGSVNAYGQLRGLPGIQTTLVDVHGASNLLINQTRPQFKDVRVRRAIAHAIDKRAIVERLTFGAATVATEDLPSFMWAYEPNVVHYDYNPARSRKLLRDAGWVARPDGLVVKNGRTLDAELAFAQNNATARAIGVQLQAYLRAVGFDVTLKGYNSAMLFAGFQAGGVYQSGNFDLAWYTMTLGVDPNSASRFSCDAFPPQGQNYSRYCSAAMDAAQRADRSTFERSARKRAYSRSQRLLARDVPIVFVFWPKDMEAFATGLRGFTPNPITPAWNAEAWQR